MWQNSLLIRSREGRNKINFRWTSLHTNKKTIETKRHENVLADHTIITDIEDTNSSFMKNHECAIEHLKPDIQSRVTFFRNSYS